MFKRLWHRIIYGSRPTEFERAVRKAYLAGYGDATNNRLEVELLLRNISDRILMNVAAQRKSLDSIVGEYADAPALLYHEIQSKILQAAKEGFYRGVEEALRQQSAEQIVRIGNLETLPKPL